MKLEPILSIVSLDHLIADVREKLDLSVDELARGNDELNIRVFADDEYWCLVVSVRVDLERGLYFISGTSTIPDGVRALPYLDACSRCRDVLCVLESASITPARF